MSKKKHHFEHHQRRRSESFGHLHATTLHPAFQGFYSPIEFPLKNTILILYCQPVLWIALQEYFNDPSDDCITRLYDAVNAMDISMAPTLSREEKFIMRASERKDVFIEKFMPQDDATLVGTASRVDLNSVRSRSVNDLSIRTRADSLSSLQSSRSEAKSNESSGGSSVVWIGNNSVQQDPQRPRSSLEEGSHHNGHSSTSIDSHTHLPRPGSTIDTHFYDTTIMYKKTKLNIRVPLSTFPEEVGDVGRIPPNQPLEF